MPKLSKLKQRILAICASPKSPKDIYAELVASGNVKSYNHMMHMIAELKVQGLLERRSVVYVVKGGCE